MNVYLVEGNGIKRILSEFASKEEIEELNLLYSFLGKAEWIREYQGRIARTMLDSGAFTYMNGRDAKNINWDKYIEEYADFINKMCPTYFIELDIDFLVGYEEVKRLRRKLEQLTNRQPIPVWHKNRGKQEFINMCKEYPYVALGGFAVKDWRQEDFKYIPWFIQTAHKYGAKIHGLGFTSIEGMKVCHFDSVDSSSWSIGNRYGSINLFQNGVMKNIDKPSGMRLKDSFKVACHNFREWQKLARYAKHYL